MFIAHTSGISIVSRDDDLLSNCFKSGHSTITSDDGVVYIEHYQIFVDSHICKISIYRQLKNFPQVHMLSLQNPGTQLLTKLIYPGQVKNIDDISIIVKIQVELFHNKDTERRGNAELYIVDKDVLRFDFDNNSEYQNLLVDFTHNTILIRFMPSVGREKHVVDILEVKVSFRL